MLNRDEEIEKIFRPKADSYKPSILSELLCCPFCGKQPETYWDSGITLDECYREGFNIKCCYIHITAIYKEDAIVKWNHRVT